MRTSTRNIKHTKGQLQEEWVIIDVMCICSSLCPFKAGSAIEDLTYEFTKVNTTQCIFYSIAFHSTKLLIEYVASITTSNELVSFPPLERRMDLFLLLTICFASSVNLCDLVLAFHRVFSFICVVISVDLHTEV